MQNKKAGPSFFVLLSININMKIADCHNDFLTSFSPDEKINYLINAKENDVKLIVSSVFTSKMKKSDVFNKIKLYKKFLNQTSIKPQTLLHIEDCFFVENECDLNNLVSLKPFSCGLTWNYKNGLASGALCASGGLSKFGTLCAKNLEENNIVVDFAHLNKQSFYDLAEIINKPIFCSHTCFSAINPHLRNLDNKQLEIIVKSDGLVGFTFVSDFITAEKSANIKDVVKHLIYFLDRFGDENIAIGTDFCGTDNLPIQLENYSSFKFLKNYLITQRICRNTIDKIFYKNFINFYNKTKKRSK